MSAWVVLSFGILIGMWVAHHFMFKRADEAEVEDDDAVRIAEYLKVNGFANLREAATKGWGDTRLLQSCKLFTHGKITVRIGKNP